MKKLKKCVLIVLCALNIFSSSACWNYREIEQLGIVTGAAIDRRDGSYMITVEMIKPSQSYSKPEIQAVVYSGEGATLFEAIRTLITKTGKKLFWSHTMVIIFDKETAEEGIQPALDWFSRDSEPRPTTLVLISKEERAKDILLMSTKNINRIVSSDIYDIIRNYGVSYRFFKTDLRTFRNNMASNSRAAVAPFVYLEHGEGHEDIRVQGTAVFKGDKLVGELNADETLYYLMIAEKIKEGLLPDINAVGTSTNVTLEIFKLNRKLNFIAENSVYRIDGNFKILTAFDEIAGTKDVIEPAVMEMVSKEMENRVKTNLEAVVKKVQTQFGADIFGFGGIIERKDPKLWKALGEKSDSIFEKIKFSAKVKIDVKGSGRTSKIIKIGE